jgi:hypothetical protein
VVEHLAGYPPLSRVYPPIVNLPAETHSVQAGRKSSIINS